MPGAAGSGGASGSVSAVVTTYNHAPYIGEAVASALAQTWPPCEVIVVDDGSTDGTAAALAPYRDRIRYLRQPNHGVAAARNAGVAMARGDLVALLDGDDTWDPQKLAVQARAAAAHPGAGLLVVDGEHVGHPEVDGTGLFWPAVRALLAAPGAATALDGYGELLRANLVSTTSQVMIPRAVLESVGPSDRSLPLGGDYDLYLRIAARYPVVLIDRRLTRWRYVATSASGPHHLRVLRWAEANIAVWRKHLGLVPPAQRPALRAQLRDALHVAAWEAALHGRRVDRAWATRYLARLAARSFPASAPVAGLLAVWAPAGAVRLMRALTGRARG